MEQQKKSEHILNTSSNLLGLCFIVLTALKMQNLKEVSLIDEVTSLAAILFMVSCLLSFLSIRTNGPRGEVYERIADTIFLTGLIAMFVLIMLITLNFI